MSCRRSAPAGQRAAGRPFKPLGLRARITSAFALGALLLSSLLSLSTYSLTRSSLLIERERAAVRAAYGDASLLTTSLDVPNPDVGATLQSLNAGELRSPLLRRGGQWFASTADNGLTEAIPTSLQDLVASGSPGVQRVDVRGAPALVVGVQLPGGAAFYEVTDLSELNRTLTVLTTVLSLVSLFITLAAVAVGRAVSRRALRPLTQVAEAAGSIASGDFTARVARDRDPDLDALALAFNAMVDEVSARSEADRRFAADVSHELRSPLQTLTAVTSVLDRRRDGLDERTGAAVDLLTEEISRFESLVTDLLELARTDRPAERRPTDVVALTRAVVSARSTAELEVDGADDVLDIDPRRYEQLLVNLVENAARHGGGAVRVGLTLGPDRLLLEVDDAGPGVPEDERMLVFDRFARGRASSARGGSEGTGLGLALVAQHVLAHRGSVAILDRPGGGARFRVILPAGPAPVLEKTDRVGAMT